MSLLISETQRDHPTQSLIWDPVTDEFELGLQDPAGKSQGCLWSTTVKEHLSFVQEDINTQEVLEGEIGAEDYPDFTIEMSFTLKGSQFYDQACVFWQKIRYLS